MNRVFVYDSFRPARRSVHPMLTINYGKIASEVKGYFQAWYRGADLHLFSMGATAVPGTGILYGEVLRITDAGLAILDQSLGMFERDEVTLETADGRVDAWIYWGPDTSRICAKIESGDWLQPENPKALDWYLVDPTEYYNALGSVPPIYGNGCWACSEPLTHNNLGYPVYRFYREHQISLDNYCYFATKGTIQELHNENHHNT